MGFTHLHVHTEYSLLDGAAQIKRVVARAKELGMESLAITDHGVMFGVVDFFEECKAQGIKPIIGCEVYTAPRSRFQKDSVLDRGQGHLVLLAKDEIGYKNLIKVVSSGFSEGFYYKPRVDHELLRAHSEGIIALSACLAGKVQSELLAGHYDGARKEALTLLDIYGPGNFYLELQDQSMPEELRINPLIKQLSKETGIPMVATNDVHYVKKEDAKAHDVLLCIQTGKTLDDVDRMRFPNDEFYLKSEKEMRNLFADVPEAIDNTMVVAEQCNFQFKFGDRHIPNYIVPEGYDQEGYVRHLCDVGLRKRYGENPSQELRDRLEYELTTIKNMGFLGYFLIVWDFINYAKSNGIMVGPGRGSAAGSIVAYCLEITDIDPIRFGLIFERFLNSERVSMPDIDVDFCVERRGEVIEYVNRKYGADHVSQIVTFGTLKAKACIKDVARVMGIPFNRALEISKMVPNKLHITLAEAIKTSPDLKAVYDEDKQIAEVLDMALALEGMPRHSSTHAAGVVIAKDPVDTYVPLVMSDKGLATQFSMTTIERLGLLKMDFLGLRNLTAIRDTLAMIKENTGVDLDLHNIDYDDKAVYKVIADGNTSGIFQLESGGMTGFMKNLQPDCLEDIIAGISLYRPGPMDSIPKYVECKKNPDKVKYLTPELEPILSPTYGCIVYQEQVMEIVRKLAGYSYGRSDLVRRAMSKKKADVMKKEREYFVFGKLNEDGTVDVPGCVRNGISESAANTLFDQMMAFAEYAFNKSHAAAYAVVAYQTAYLKKYYPVEFYAALMTNPQDSAAVAGYIRNANDMGITVLPPNVNKSKLQFSVEDGGIRFGLLAVKHVGEGVVNEIIAARNRKMPNDIFEFIDGLDVHNINKQAMESLISAGALDCFPGNRAQKFAVIAELIEGAQATAKANLSGQLSLFSMGDVGEPAIKMERELPFVEENPKQMLLSMEKEMLGIYISEHPLADAAERIRAITDMDTERLANAEEDDSIVDGMTVVMAGLITTKKNFVTKKGQLMAFMTLEDLMGSLEVVVFPKAFEAARDVIEEDNIVVIKGKIDIKEEGVPKLLADRVVLLSEFKPSRTKAAGGKKEAASKPKPVDNYAMIKIVIPESFSEPDGLTAFRSIARANRGSMPVAILVSSTGNKYKLDYDLWVEPSDEFYNSVMATFGRDCIRA